MAFVSTPLPYQTAATGAFAAATRGHHPARGFAALRVATPFLSGAAAGRSPAPVRSSTGRRAPPPAGRSGPASAPDDAARVALVKHLHARKTALFSDVVATGAVPLRPGVARLVNEALDAGVPVGVCSTSNELAVQQIVNMLGADTAARIPVFAGDVVAAKKPAPDVYLLAAEKLGVDPAECAVVEDSAIGLAAALAAGMRVLVTVSTYTAGEAFSGAARVVGDLDAGGVDLAAVREVMN
eukprot:contig_6239_g1415